MSIFSFFEKRLNPYPDDDFVRPSKHTMSFLWACTKGLRRYLFAFLLLTALVGAYEALLFAWVGELVDYLHAYKTSELLPIISQKLWLMSAVVVLSPILVFLASLVHFQTLQGVFPMQMRWRFHKHMLDQSMQFYQDEFAGRVAAKVMQTALSVRDVVMIVADVFSYLAVYLITSGVVLLSLDVRLLLPFLLWLLLFFACVCFFVPRLEKTAAKQADARALMTGRITDAYTNITTVKLFSHSLRELDYAKSAMTGFMKTVHAQMRWVSVFEAINYALNAYLILSVGALGVYLWLQNSLSVGAVAASLALCLRLMTLTQWMMWQTTHFFENLGVVQDGMQTLCTPKMVVDDKNAKVLAVTHGEIYFKNIQFAYQKDGARLPLLQNFNLHIKPGEKIGLVGKSGAGKSTLVNLLLRFYELDGGQILIDNQDIKHVSQQSLRQNIGMVTQDTSLLHRGIKDNIAYGAPNASHEDIVNAAKKAHAYEFISHLHDSFGNTGFDTHVGERGIKLSGGQRQRIAIARVMLKNAPILLLDEATSALDSQIEEAITESLHDMMQGKTVIAIAHRLSTIAALDRLVVIDGGSIVEMGTHAELLAKNGVYAGLWNRQSGGFLGDE